MANRAARLKKLEAKAKAMATAAHPRPRLFVVREGAPLPAEYVSGDLVIQVVYLPRKSANAEEWVAQCQERSGRASQEPAC